ncbi:MAG: acyl-CoA dehydrogenase family protein [Novosphingobium sp.]
MDFEFTDDQRMLREGAERLLAETYDFGQRSAWLSEPEGWSRRQWRRFAEMGLLGLPFDVADGGFGGGPTEIMIVMEAFGRALVVEPYLSTVLLGGGFLQLGGSQEQRATLLPRIIEGDLLLAFAQAEPNSRYDLGQVGTTARQVGGNWVIDGHKRHVLGGDSADKFIVSARIDGMPGDSEGLSVFLVDGDARGVTRRGYRLQDHTRAAEIRFDTVHVGPEAIIGEPGRGLGLMTRVVGRAIGAQCCEAVGVMASAHERTVEYLKLRKQFGATLGSFQALQHRAVDMYVQLELARSIALYGMTASEGIDAAERNRAVAATKVQIGRTARRIGQEAIQLHGGIGMTEEHPIGHYFRRLTMIEMQFGDTSHHLARLAEMGGLIAPEPD